MSPNSLPASIFERFFHSEIANCKWSVLSQSHRRFFHNQLTAGKSKKMKNQTIINIEFVKKLNALPEKQKQQIVDSLTTQQAVEVFNIALKLASF